MTRDGEFYRYTCPISDNQVLYVQLRRTGETWEILRWQSLALSQLPEEQTLPLWENKGGTP